MKDYLTHKLWNDLEVTSPKILWVASVMLNIPSELVSRYRRQLPSLIYRVYHTLEYSENKYLNAYNGSRADLVVELVNPPDDNERMIRIDSEPHDDISYWLATHVLGFTDTELAVLCSISEDCLWDPGRDLLPLIKSSYRILRGIKFEDPVFQNYHRSRHLLIRYYLDAEYHEL